MSERLSFENAARELGVSESELESLVADGQIAAAKDGDELLISRSAIETYKSQSGEPAILMSDDEIDLLDGDDDIDFGIDLEEPAADDDKTDEISLDAEIDLGSGGLDLDLDTGETEDLSLGDPDETVVDLGGGLLDMDDGTDSLLEGDLGDDTLLDTDVLDLGDDDTETFDLDTAEETLLDADEGGALLRGGGARVMQMKRKKGQPAFTALLAVSGLLMLLPLAVLLSVIYSSGLSPDAVDSAGDFYKWITEYNYLGSVAQSLAGLFG